MSLIEIKIPGSQRYSIFWAAYLHCFKQLDRKEYASGYLLTPEILMDWLIAVKTLLILITLEKQKCCILYKKCSIAYLSSDFKWRSLNLGNICFKICEWFQQKPKSTLDFLSLDNGCRNGSRGPNTVTFIQYVITWALTK